MKTYVLTVSTSFPQSHPRAGEPTGFVEGIRGVVKIHTIRKNYPLWEKRFKAINAGEAVLSLRTWTGKPYRSKQLEFMRLDKSHGIGIQKINLLNIDTCIDMEVRGVEPRFGLDKISRNDGLSIGDFLDWFGGVNVHEELAIIHFTPFRY